MRKLPAFILSSVLGLFFISYPATGGENVEGNGSVSGAVVGGHRLVTVPHTREAITLKVYRGDYVKFIFDETISDRTMSIPDLGISAGLPREQANAPVFKMKTTGSFPFSIGSVQGIITVSEYITANYREVTSREAADMLQNKQLLLLDVRTRHEFNSAHIKGATLIPVQEPQSRLKEISNYKDKEVVIYCAVGNRSTVASKILIDNGFKHIVNMRHGIVDWYRKKFPIVR